MSNPELFVLGAPRLVRGGEPVELDTRKAMALLVYLAVTGQAYSRDALATLFWPEHDQARARTHLRRALWMLKKAAGPELLAVEREHVGLGADSSLWLDATQFRQLLARCEEHDHDARAVCAACLPHLSQAAALYQDDFLAGFSLPDCPEFDDWQFFQAESLRQALAAALERLAQGYRSQSQPETALPYARRWLSLDPLHEPAQRELMRLYAQLDQQAAALRQYEAYARLLDDELGLPPEEETTTLYEAIKAKRLVEPLLRAKAQQQPAGETEGISPPPSRSPAPLHPWSPLTAHPIASSDQLEGHRFPERPPRETPPPETTNRQTFVARQQELAWLNGRLDTALAGEGQVAFVIGEVGQGKTALLQAFAQRAQAARPNLIVAGGNCNAYTGSGDPYLPFREILERLTGDAEVQTATGPVGHDQTDHLSHFFLIMTQALVETGPDLLNRLIPARSLLKRASGAAPAGAAWLADLQALVNRPAYTGSAALQQSALFEQFAKVLERVAQQQSPLLLILDDLQWIDSGSAGLLLHLGRRLVDVPILIVGAYRPAEVAMGRSSTLLPAGVAGQTERHPLEQVIHEFRRMFGDILLDLSQAEGEAFIEALLAAQPNALDDDFRQTLYRQTRGHPLFTVELLRDMQERGDLVQDKAGRWLAKTNLDWQSLPARVEGAIGERISRLETPLRELLQMASLEGEEFTAEMVAQVLKRDEREVIGQLSQELDRKHQLVQALGLKRDGKLRLSRYRFRHILIQRYLYSGLDDIERVYQHEAAGRALETIYGEQTDEIAISLARHFEAAEMLEQATPYLQKAGDQARRAVALVEATRYYRQALENWPDADKAGQAILQRKRGECLWMLGHLQDALKLFERCYVLFEALNDKVAAGATQRLMGRVFWELGDRGRSLEHYWRALAILEAVPESVELARAVSSISRMHMLAAEYEQAIAWGERALVLARKLEAKEVAIHASNNIGASLASSSNPESGLALLRESLHQALKLGIPPEICRAYINLGESLICHCRYAEAETVLSKLLVYAAQIGAAQYQGAALVGLAKLDWWQGRWAAAMTRCRQIRDWRDEFQGATVLKVWVSTLLGRIYNDLGRPQLARQELEAELRTARTHNELLTTAPHLGQLARSVAGLGLTEEAAALIQEFLALLKGTSAGEAYNSVSSLLFACRWLAQQRPKPNSSEIAGDCLDQLERIEAQFHSRESAAALAEARGSEALSQARATAAVEQFQQAVVHWDALSRPYDRARALNQLGQALRRTGDTDQTQAAFSQAFSIIETLAGELDEADTQASFLASPLVQQIRGSQGAL